MSSYLGSPMNYSRPRRGLPRRRSRYLMNPAHGTSPVFISPSETPLHPLDRWEASPPEAEGASLSAIRNALENPSIETSGNDAGSGHDLFQRYRRPASRAASTTSAESGSVASSRRSDRSGVSSGSQGRVRKKQTGPKKRRSAATNPRIFCCTFCCDKFKSKFDWMRHEKSLHLNLENWICAPFGGSVVLESTGRAHCAYCNQLDPTMDHLNQHNHAPCHEQTRKFRRKDHLVQHLRLFHRLDTLPLIDNWKQATTNFSSRCGFCDSHLSSWDERADHLAVHFRNGCTMAHWKGDHNFPPEIAANITHSVPPYMLDFESRSFVPFSATNRDASDHLSQMLSRATYLDRPDTDTQNNHGHRPVETQTPDVPWPEHAHEHAHEHEHEHGNQFAPQSPQVDSYTEVLTRHLSHYAQRMMRSGIIPTDEMFQTEARRLLFDSEDTWDQTLADNIHWLGQFRQETCSAVHKPANPSASGPHEPSQ
ncbi:hypothetical protein BJX99DRAFT_271316 [Aspergillus californicus]